MDIEILDIGYCESGLKQDWLNQNVGYAFRCLKAAPSSRGRKSLVLRHHTFETLIRPSEGSTAYAGARPTGFGICRCPWIRTAPSTPHWKVSPPLMYRRWRHTCTNGKNCRKPKPPNRYGPHWPRPKCRHGQQPLRRYVRSTMTTQRRSGGLCNS